MKLLKSKLFLKKQSIQRLDEQYLIFIAGGRNQKVTYTQGCSVLCSLIRNKCGEVK